MPLFHPRVVNAAVEKADNAPIPDSHLAILTAWAESITSGSILKQKETALHGHFIQHILLEVLGYTGFEGGKKSWSLQREQQIGKGSVDVALGTFGPDASPIILAPFELKGAKTKDLDAIMPGRHKSPIQQAWEYAMDAPGAKWVLVSNYLEIRLYAVGYGRQDYERFDLSTLTEPREYRRLRQFISAENLLGGRTRALLKESDKVGKEITDKLYSDYKQLREQLIRSLRADNPEIPELNIISHAQTILDRVLFVAFAEDQTLLPEHTLEKAFTNQDPYNPKPVWDNFNGLFRAIDKGNPKLNIPAYNGGLFRSDKVLENLCVSDSLCEGFKQLGEYDFNSEVSVTVLGHIFEQSITDLEALQAKVTGEEVEVKAKATTGKRKREGVVYTPDSITRFIVEQTLGRHLEKQFEALWEQHLIGRNKTGERKGEWKSDKAELSFWSDYQNVLRHLRVVDPACGSGAFLVAAFDYLYAEYTRVNDRLTTLKGGMADLFDLDKEILNQNLYGVDINHESIEISKLSLWLKTAKRGKTLNSLDHNLRVGDSLIEDSNYSLRAFAWKNAFPEVFDAGGFDVVLGNPPYVRMEFLKHLKPYLETRYVVTSDRADLYCYFYELGLRLLKHGGRLGYISSNTFFKTGSGKPLRQYLLAEAMIESVVDFGDLQVFDGVTTYPAVLVLEKGAPNPEHQLQFLVLTALPETDISAEFEASTQPMAQGNLSEESWQLQDHRLAKLQHKITEGKLKLKEVYGSPLYGIKTGLNEAFVIDRTTRDHLVAEDPKAQELLKPFLEGKDIKPWHIESRDLWLIYIPKNKININDYPSIRNHLIPYKEKLEKRATKQEWFELQQAQLAYSTHFKEPKIVYGHFSAEALFSYDLKSFYSNDKSYIIPNADYFLLGLLNSKIHWILISSMCPFVRGGFYEVRVQYIETLPIPKARDAEKAEIATLAETCQQAAEERYTLQETFRHRIPDLTEDISVAKLTNKLKSWWELEDFAAFRKEAKKALKAEIPLRERSDWEQYFNEEKAKVKALSTKIVGLEAELNTKVYTLFSLTADDITLLEQELEKTTAEH